MAIAGADQGLGFELARLYAQDGHTVLAGCVEALNLSAGSAGLGKAAFDKVNSADNGRYIDTAGNDMPWNRPGRPSRPGIEIVRKTSLRLASSG